MWACKDGQHLHEEKATQVRMTIGGKSELYGIYRGQREKVHCRLEI